MFFFIFLPYTKLETFFFPSLLFGVGYLVKVVWNSRFLFER